MENHRGFWNYYGVNFEDVFQDEGVARDFIYNYSTFPPVNQV